MDYILHPLIGLIISFIGSLPFGIINISVADTAIRKGLRAGLIVGFGASLVEFIQVLLSLSFADLIMGNATFDLVFNAVASCVLLGLAIYYLFFAKDQTFQEADSKVRERGYSHFFKGMAVSALNVMVFPYFIFYGTWLNGNDWIQLEFPFILLFGLGTTLGTMLVMWLYAWGGVWIVERSMRFTRYINRSIGVLFLLFAAYQIYQLYQLSFA